MHSRYRIIARRGIIGITLLAALAACGGGDPRLMNVTSNTRGPDEFAILPTQPLQIPTDFANLPQPIPGGPNRTDPAPQADAIAALGGNAGAAMRPVPATDGALVAHATRTGVTPTIRAELAAADLEFRRANRSRLLERAFNVNVYNRVYGPFSLDQHAELERWRAAGVRTVGAPPAR